MKPDARRAAHGEEANRRETAEDEIVEQIYAAILEHRLPAGTKLGEAALSEAFGVSRARVRRVLLLLASREVVELQANRGAFVARPGRDEARDVFEARRSIEPTIVRRAVQRMRGADLGTLKAHMAREIAAREAGDRHAAIRLSGEFHLRLAELAGNPVLLRFAEELVMRSSLIIGLFGSPTLARCSAEEHRELIDALDARDAEAAAAAMLRHLQHIESELEITAARDAAVDLRALFKRES